MSRLLFYPTLLLVALAAQEAPSPVVRVSVSLVQLDAVVVDSKGDHVAGLTKEDFEVYQDGVKQAITRFAWVPGAVPGAAVPVSAPPRPANGALVPVTGRPVTPERARRSIVLLVDTGGMSGSSLYRVKDALRRYVRDQLQPGDLAAVMEVPGVDNAFQRFTDDRRVLLAAVERLKWRSAGAGDASPIRRLGEPEDELVGGSPAKQRAMLNSFATLRYVATELRSMPGRKSVVYFSDGMRLYDRAGTGEEAREHVQAAYRRMIDAVSRSGVVVSTVDARGLLTSSILAMDNWSSYKHSVQSRPSNWLSGSVPVLSALNDRSLAITDNWDGLIELARSTGGLFFRNTNDLEGAARQCVDDLNGYYLLGYDPPKDTFFAAGQKEKLHRTAIRVKRPGLDVRARAGFIAMPEAAAPAVPPQGEVQRAVLAPFDAGGIRLRLTAMFGNAAGSGNFVAVAVRVPATELTFAKGADGRYSTTMEMASSVFSEDGTEVERRADTYSIRLGQADYEKALRQGLEYNLHHKVGKPGPGQVRVAVRDSATGRLGSASHYLEVPDVEKGELALSGVVMESGSGWRVFAPGTPIGYGFFVYNPAAGVAVQETLYRGGRAVWSGKPYAPVAAQPDDPQRVKVEQQLNFGRSTPTGEYQLQIVATAPRPGQKEPARAEQWIDFELR